jgi:hypothetical protein
MPCRVHIHLIVGVFQCMVVWVDLVNTPKPLLIFIIYLHIPNFKSNILYGLLEIGGDKHSL